MSRKYVIRKPAKVSLFENIGLLGIHLKMINFKGLNFNSFLKSVYLKFYDFKFICYNDLFFHKLNKFH